MPVLLCYLNNYSKIDFVTECIYAFRMIKKRHLLRTIHKLEKSTFSETKNEHLNTYKVAHEMSYH